MTAGAAPPARCSPGRPACATSTGRPRVEIERPDAFFEQAEAEYPDAPVWVGELYLEMHRGTYTSQAKTKQGNRRSEHLLREAELWAATAAVRAGTAYPSAALDRIWKSVLLNQFHDILPGSSIGWVHREAVATYAALAEELEAIIGQAQAALAGARPGRGGVQRQPARPGRGRSARGRARWPRPPRRPCGARMAASSSTTVW